MTKVSDKNYYYIIGACVLTYLFYLIFEYIFTNGAMGVPLDDTWIHFQFAENFTKGFFYQYNPGEPTAGTTSPLYVIVLGAFSLLVRDFIISSVFLSAAFHLLFCIFIYKISLLILRSDGSPLKHFNPEKFSPRFVSLLIALLTVFTGRLTWAALSGMETTMFTLFCLAGVYCHIKNLQQNKFTIVPCLLIALATVSRPEAFLLFGLYLFDVIMNFFKNNTFKRNISKLILGIFIFALITFPYLIFSYNISGHFFPNTFRGQGGGLKFIPNLEYLRIATIYFFRDNFAVALLYLLSIIFYFSNLKKYFIGLKNINLIFLWIIFLPIVSSLLLPNWRHHVRYMIPILPFINLAGIYFFMIILNSEISLKNFIMKKRNIIWIFPVISLVYFAVYAIALGKNTGNINDQQVKLAKWVSENVGKNETIALNDIGAITFLNKNRVIDIVGLITPEMLHYRQFYGKGNVDSVNYLLKKNNVSYIIIYDEWFKQYLDKYGKDLTFITSAILEDNTICGGIEMKVYKTNFNHRKY